MKVTTWSLFSLATIGTVEALPLPDVKSVLPRVDFSPKVGYNSMIVGGYTSTALSYLDPKRDSYAALKKALSNPSRAYND